MGAAPRIQLHRRVAQVLAAGAGKGVAAAPAEIASQHEGGRGGGGGLGASRRGARGVWERGRGGAGRRPLPTRGGSRGGGGVARLLAGGPGRVAKFCAL